MSWPRSAGGGLAPTRPISESFFRLILVLTSLASMVLLLPYAPLPHSSTMLEGREVLLWGIGEGGFSLFRADLFCIFFFLSAWITVILSSQPYSGSTGTTGGEIKGT